MASFKSPFDSEGCSSSESGWTTYIASAFEEEDAEFSDRSKDSDGDKHHVTSHNSRKKDDDDESDDSLASDASSGSSYRRRTHPGGQGNGGQGSSHGASRSNKDKSNHKSKISSLKNGGKQEEKRVENSTKKK